MSERWQPPAFISATLVPVVVFGGPRGCFPSYSPSNTVEFSVADSAAVSTLSLLDLEEVPSEYLRSSASSDESLDLTDNAGPSCGLPVEVQSPLASGYTLCINVYLFSSDHATVKSHSS